MPVILSLPETVDLAQKVLDENKIMPASKRASSALSERSVRWYTTAGILDAPGREGHTAAYGRRHLLQLLYTRQAQATGTPLERIRKYIAHLSTEDLAAQINLDLSSVPADLGDVTSRKDQPFWERSPEDAPSEQRASVLLAHAIGSSRAPRGPRRVAATPATTVEYVVRVGTVSVSLDHDPSQSELATITMAAQPLLTCLEGDGGLPFINSFTESGPAVPLSSSTTPTNRSM